MIPIDSIELDATLEPHRLWPALASVALGWLDREGLARRDAVIVLPFAELLLPCRQALACAGGWLPRVETLRTLAMSIGPAESGSHDAPCGDPSIDRLVAERWMSRVPGLRDWARRDRLAYDEAVSDVVEAAHALMRTAAAQAPAGRSAWWTHAARALRCPDGPGAMEAALAGLALQWAATAPAPATDHLHEWRPSAWIMLEAGGADAVAAGLMDQAARDGVRCLRVVADPASGDPFAAHVDATPRVWTAQGAEDEAWAAADAVIQAVSDGPLPVALVAQDRMLVRRIRALLERRGLTTADESGWALSTTRAAARLMALLRAARPTAGPDAWIDALKASAGATEAAWTDRLERHWRRHGAGARASDRGPDVELARAIDWWETQRRSWQEFSAAARQPLAGWLRALSRWVGQTLRDATWIDDPAASAVRSALCLDGASVRVDVDAVPMSLDEFVAWVEHVLERSSFIAPVSVGSADVVITPLARAMLRPFGAVVLPAADERRLGPGPPAPALLGESALRALGMDAREARQRRGALAFVQLLRHRRVVLLHRSVDGDETLGASPWIDRLQLARRRAGLAPLELRQAPMHRCPQPPQPVAPPAPDASTGLPEIVSASSVEALRACPYRFFARSVLRLGEIEELEADPDKRDYGSVLHAALHHFHDIGTDDRDGGHDDDRAQRRLVDAVASAARDAGLDAAAMLPYAAGLDAFARRYLQWQHERDAAQWRYDAGEIALDCRPEALGGLTLRGRVDRIDRHAGSGALQVIDYKTGSAESLRARVRQPLEDTQLAFYAAQVIATGRGGQGLNAAYLALDERERIVEVPHVDVGDSATQLIEGLAHDWRRMRDGHPLFALGDGALCETCEMRGLCRRDHWSDGPGTSDS